MKTLSGVARKHPQSIREFQSRLFHQWEGDPFPWCYLSHALEEVQYEGFQQSLFHQAKGVSNAGGEPLQKCPLLLE